MAKDDEDTDYRESEDEDSNAENIDTSEPPSKTVNGQPASPQLDKQKAQLIRKRKRQNDRKYQDDMSDEEPEDGDVDTDARKTEKGGYAHTMKSKLRISRANKGNTPWNKGGNRSAADKAKISAGVRARNRAILLEKLKKLGMSEEEWLQKKKQIKYLRERVRRAKKNAKEEEILQQQKLLQHALANAETPGTTTIPAPPAAKKAKTTKEPGPPSKTKKKQPETVSLVNGRAKSPPKTSTQSTNSQSAKTPTAALPTFMTKNIKWTPHAFDAEAPNGTAICEKNCPSGGPGGLICCSACTKQYSEFLSATSTDIENQTRQQVNEEVMELLGFLSGAKSQLNDSVEIVKARTGTGPTMKVMAAIQENAKEKKQSRPVAKKNSGSKVSTTKKTNENDRGLNKRESSVLEDESLATNNANGVTELLSEKKPPPAFQFSGQEAAEPLSYQLPYELNDDSPPQLGRPSNGYHDEGEGDEKAVTFVAV